jgi:hypothetical protein
MNANAPVRVGELEDLATPFQRHVVPLQSLRQALWVVGAVFVMLTAYLFGVWHEGGHISSRIWMFVGLDGSAREEFGSPQGSDS